MTSGQRAGGGVYGGGGDNTTTTVVLQAHHPHKKLYECPSCDKRHRCRNARGDVAALSDGALYHKTSLLYHFDPKMLIMTCGCYVTVEYEGWQHYIAAQQ